MTHSFAFVRETVELNSGRSDHQNDEASDATFSVFLFSQERPKGGKGRRVPFFKKTEKKKSCSCCFPIFQVFFLSLKILTNYSLSLSLSLSLS